MYPSAIAMKLKDMIAGLRDIRVYGDTEMEINGISSDSRDISPGMVFVAIRGGSVDGHDFIKDAVDRGAVCVVTERQVHGIHVPQVVADDTRDVLSGLCDIFYGRPSCLMRTIGVTGTNGKTTTTYLIESIFREAGLKPGVIGTVNYRYDGCILQAPHTTPDPVVLHRLLKEMVDADTGACIMEVSSHALSQKRVDGMRFDVGVFTNLTQDHLDYHGTMEEYFLAKAHLFSLLKEGGIGVINMDDPWGVRLMEMRDMDVLGYTIEEGADIYPIRYSIGVHGIDADIHTPRGTVRVSSSLVGEYNLRNILASIGVGIAMGLDVDVIARGVDSLKAVPGRLEKVRTDYGFTVYVDYAHTPDALERVLLALRAITKGRLITVFGCGGNRDRTKRPKMGGIATRLSDITIITSDNPREEDPIEIIKDIETGIDGAERLEANGNPVGRSYMVIPDRSDAIERAIGLARREDTVLIAGKGHEDYQIIGTERLPFDDIDTVRTVIDGLKRD